MNQPDDSTGAQYSVCMLTRAIVLPILLLALVGCDAINAAQLFLANDGTTGVWDSDEPSMEIPFDFEGVVIIPVKVNQGPVLNFAQDTGAPMTALIGHPKTEALNLSLGEEVSIGGSGSGLNPTGRIVRNLTVSLANISLLDQTAVWIPWQAVSFIQAEEEVFFDGIIGYDLFKRYVVELDFERLVMTLHQPEHYTYQGHGEVFELEMSGRKPYITADVTLLNGKSTSVKLHVDSGSRSTVSLIPDASPEIVIPDQVIPSEGRGLSGGSTSALGRIKKLSLGSLDLDSVLTRFSLTGYSTSGGRQGVLGMTVLKRFKVIFNYPQNQMILEPTAGTYDPFEANMSGLHFSSFSDGYVIRRVEEGTPGSEAGFQARDLLDSINDRPAQSLSYQELNAFMRRGDGVALEVCVKRNAKSICAPIQLKKRI